MTATKEKEINIEITEKEMEEIQELGATWSLLNKCWTTGILY